MNNFIKNKFVRFVFFTIVCYIFVRIIFAVWGSLDALGGIDLEREYNKKSSEFLLKELHSPNWFRESISYGILVDRKDKRILPYILKRINVKNDTQKGGYIQALVRIGDKPTIPVIVRVMDEQSSKSPDNYVYWECVVGLAKFQYEPIWSILVKLLESNNAGDIRLGADGMGAFGKKEALPYLERAKAKVVAGKYEPWFEYDKELKREVRVAFSVRDIDDAIKKIQEANTVAK